MPQKKASWLWRLAAIGLMAKSAGAATYYVSPNGSDSSPGTQAAPWRTFQKAAGTLIAGDTAVFLDGVYEEGEIPLWNSGTAAKPITFKAQNKHGAVLSSVSGCNPAISVLASYNTIEDFRITVSPNNQSCPTYSSAGVAIRCWESWTGVKWEACRIRGVLVDYHPNRDLGIKTNQDHSIVENSIVHGGIESMGNFGAIFRDNIAYDDVGEDHSTGASPVGILTKGGSRDFQAYNNIVRITRPGGMGIILGGYSCDACHWDTSTNFEDHNSVAFNNIVINDSGGPTTGGLGLWGASNSAFFNNVVIGAGIFITLGGDTKRAPAHNPAFRNNIIDCGGGAAVGEWNGYWTGTLTVDRNNFYNCTGLPTQTNPIVGNPLFVNRLSDWHLQAGSPAIGAGAALTFTGFTGLPIDVSKDYAGIQRTEPWDLGIYDTVGAAAGAAPTVRLGAPAAGQQFSASGIAVDGAALVHTTVTIISANAARVELSRDGFGPFHSWTSPTSSTDAYSMVMCVNCFDAGETLPRQMTLRATAYNSAGASVSANVTVTVTTAPATDLNGDGTTNAADVQLAVNQALGIASCASSDIDRDGSCTVVDVQLVVNRALDG